MEHRTTAHEWLQRPENAAINRTFGLTDFRARAAAAGVELAMARMRAEADT